MVSQALVNLQIAVESTSAKEPWASGVQSKVRMGVDVLWSSANVLPRREKDVVNGTRMSGVITFFWTLVT